MSMKLQTVENRDDDDENDVNWNTCLNIFKFNQIFTKIRYGNKKMNEF